MSTLVRTKDILLHSRELIEEHGLCQGAAKNDAGNICITTAIQIAIGHRNTDGEFKYPLKYIDNLSKIFAQVITTIHNKPDVTSEELDVTNAKLDNTITRDIQALQRWNDLASNTQEKVINILYLSAIESETE